MPCGAQRLRVKRTANTYHRRENRAKLVLRRGQIADGHEEVVALVANDRQVRVDAPVGVHPGDGERAVRGDVPDGGFDAFGDAGRGGEGVGGAHGWAAGRRWTRKMSTVSEGDVDGEGEKEDVLCVTSPRYT